jgi:hypothetical protein
LTPSLGRLQARLGGGGGRFRIIKLLRRDGVILDQLLRALQIGLGLLDAVASAAAISAALVLVMASDLRL